MAEGLMTVGILLVIVWFFARRSFNYKPGSKNWAMNAEARLSDSEEANNIAYRLQEEMVNSGHRLTQVEMDLERMNAIISMYKDLPVSIDRNTQHMVGRSMRRLALRGSIKEVSDSTYLNLPVEELVPRSAST